ncbi:hypothetical protein ASA1KI_18180 [Opitutales bacterium ASA1]|uniref:hypothetical protein n=1 Tax=Congregicoccus parvus TaxID=3081749 RepID=UPI002B2CF947|nr:hypothetical protein ASA1KI_18180 [Opitutales bacterium ASA1]
MNRYERSWNRLTVLARSAASEPIPGPPPPGFATRVAARGLAECKRAGSAVAWDWMAVRGFAVACLIMATALAVTWPLVKSGDQEDLADLADMLVVADASR